MGTASAAVRPSTTPAAAAQGASRRGDGASSAGEAVAATAETSVVGGHHASKGAHQPRQRSGLWLAAVGAAVVAVAAAVASSRGGALLGYRSQVTTAISWLPWAPLLPPLPPRDFAVSSCSGTQAAAALETFLGDRAASASWRLRCMTRSPDSPRVRRLAAMGVTVVAAGAGGSPARVAGVDDGAARTPLPEATAGLLRGATALFLITHSAFGTPGAEAAEAAAWGEAATLHNVPLVVFSGGARTGVAALDAKADAENRLRALLPAERLLFVHSSFFYENLVVKGGEPRLASCALREGAGGGVGCNVSSVTFTNPLPASTAVVMHSAADIGRAAAAAALRPGRFHPGEQVRVVGSRCTPAEFASAFEAACPGARATYAQMSIEELQRAAFPDDPAAGAAVGDMYRAYLNSTLLVDDATIDVAAVRARFPEAATVGQWFRSGGGVDAVAAACRALPRR